MKIGTAKAMLLSLGEFLASNQWFFFFALSGFANSASNSLRGGF